MPIIEPSYLLQGKVLRNHGDGLFLELLSRTRVLERAILPSALAALTGEISTYLVRHILGKNVGHLGGCKRVEHTHVSDGAPLGRRIGDAIAATLLIALSSRFFSRIAGGRRSAFVGGRSTRLRRLIVGDCSCDWRAGIRLIVRTKRVLGDVCCLNRDGNHLGHVQRELILKSLKH